VAARGRASVASWIVNRHRFVPSLASPYTVVLGRLEDQEDILIPGAWGGRPDGIDLAVGLPIDAGFEDLPVDPAGGGGSQPLAVIRWQAAGR